MFVEFMKANIEFVKAITRDQTRPSGNWHWTDLLMLFVGLACAACLATPFVMAGILLWMWLS